MQLKVLSYNILMGFHTDEENPKLQEERLKAAQRVVREVNPDLLILLEACNPETNNHNIKVNYSEAFALPFHFHGATDTTHKHGNSILSKLPLLESANYTMDKRKHVRTHLYMNGRNIRIDAVHPSPHLSEEEKVRFMRSLLRDSKENYILAGDFNSWSDDDAPKNLEKVIARFKEFPNLKDHPEWAEKKVRDLATCGTIKKVKEYGLIDTHIEKGQTGYTIPTNLLSKNKSASARLDYIFCSPDIKVIDAGIIKNADTEIASDHHPVYAVLEI